MVRVVACRFMRLSCSEDDHPLFRRYYARSCGASRTAVRNTSNDVTAAPPSTFR
ncbi:hypothetical protein DVH05_011771 [Phytophthora capsici]|nr:hypothetical protein DVH05_011771 [Phytophthora capsici]